MPVRFFSELLNTRIRFMLPILGTVLIPGLIFTPPCLATPATQPATQPSTQPAHAMVPPRMSDRVPLDYPGLANVVAYATDFYSGAVPEGDAGFDSLKKLGIRTIISVDGAVPEVDKAKARRMRYVHLPFGYNGMSTERKMELVRAVHDLPHPLYVHCHHGKHRSAAAAGTVAVSLGLLSNKDAVARMKVSGTAPSYLGLYGDTMNAKKESEAAILAAPDDFPEVMKPRGLTRSMVVIDEIHENLKEIKQAGWQVPETHPDLVPLAEAGRLYDLFRDLHQDEKVKARPKDFKRHLEKATAAASALEQGLDKGVSSEELDTEFDTLDKSCKGCHSIYRNK